jgi:hypothetical protein
MEQTMDEIRLKANLKGDACLALLNHETRFIKQSKMMTK